MTESTTDEPSYGRTYHLLTEHGIGIGSALALIGICAAFEIPAELWGALPGSRTVWAILGAVLAALAYGPYALASERLRNDEREMEISYRAGYATLNGLVVLLAIFVVLSTIGDDPAVHPETALQVTLGTALVGYLAVLTVMERVL